MIQKKTSAFCAQKLSFISVIVRYSNEKKKEKEISSNINFGKHLEMRRFGQGLTIEMRIEKSICFAFSNV